MLLQLLLEFLLLRDKFLAGQLNFLLFEQSLLLLLSQLFLALFFVPFVLRLHILLALSNFYLLLLQALFFILEFLLRFFHFLLLLSLLGFHCFLHRLLVFF